MQQKRIAVLSTLRIPAIILPVQHDNATYRRKEMAQSTKSACITLLSNVELFSSLFELADTNSVVSCDEMHNCVPPQCM